MQIYLKFHKFGFREEGKGGKISHVFRMQKFHQHKFLIKPVFHIIENLNFGNCLFSVASNGEL